MVNRDDEFSPNVKEKLAARVGYRCSFPGCEAITIGPSNEASDATSSIGMACHISAASSGKGARRYRPDMSAADRRSINNGIWMCYTHGKLIDTDENRFTISQLEKWREIAELRAQRAVDRTSPVMQPLFHLDLASGEFEVLKTPAENRIIGEALHDAGVGEIWGVDAMHAVRDCIIEIARNARAHGLAKTVTVSISGRCVSIEDDGADFDVWSLYQKEVETGGTLAISHLLDHYREQIVLSSYRADERNRVTISLVRSSEDVRKATPCHLEFTLNDLSEDASPHFIERGCHAIYIILPPFTSPSDAVVLSNQLHWLRLDGRPLIFIAENISKVVRDRMRRLFPGARVMLNGKNVYFEDSLWLDGPT